MGFAKMMDGHVILSMRGPDTFGLQKINETIMIWNDQIYDEDQLCLIIYPNLGKKIEVLPQYAFNLNSVQLIKFDHSAEFRISHSQFFLDSMLCPL